MKVLASADWHIKLGQKNVPIPWAAARFREMFRQIHELSTQADAHIIMGDVFDKLPSMEELELYFEFISKVRIPTYIIDGNHEASKKGKTFLTHLKAVTERSNPRVNIVDDYADILGIDVIPYCRLKEFASGKHPEFNNKICISHFRAEIPPHVKPEIDLSLFDRWSVVLAGDLHSYDNCQRNILYPGSPVTTSFHRHRVDTGVILLDTSTLTHAWLKLELPQLIRKTIHAGEPTPATDYDHTIYEVEGDMSELSAVNDSDLIDKKIVRRQ
ncbi:metallophosphoesterase, partial [Candidatus Bathyarchaeota archaeon]|nr:metallophosphoesterase [Candidatus Bathyarchaeota archaeon]